MTLLWAVLALDPDPGGLEATSDPPAEPVPQWKALDEQAAAAHRGGAFVVAARTWEQALRLIDDQTEIGAAELAELAVHSAVTYDRAGFPRAGLGALELADTLLEGRRPQGAPGEFDAARSRVGGLMESLDQRAASRANAIEVGVPPLAMGPTATVTPPDSRAIGLLYGGSAAIALGLGSSVMAGYGAALERSNRADSNDRPHARTFIGVGVAGAVSLVPVGIAALVIGTGRLHGHRSVALSPSGSGLSVRGHV